MGKMSRNKGARGEREIVAAFADRGVELHRTPNSGAFSWHESMPGDVQGLDGFHIEVKRAERIMLTKWLEQAEDDCPEGDTPLLIYRSNGQPWRVVMPLDAFMDTLLGKGEEVDDD